MFFVPDVGFINDSVKCCTKCEQVKAMTEFGSGHVVIKGRPYKDSWCRACRTENSKVWKATFPEKHLAGTRKLSKQNRAVPEKRFLMCARTRVYQALKGQVKFGNFTEVLGCSVEELAVKLEGLFRPGMTWENYGPAWHVDHIKPCARFDLRDPEHQKQCFHFSNLQPLFKRENLIKGAKFTQCQT
jgi:hypothetical protein